MAANIPTLSLIATVILAFLGYLVTYLNGLAASQRGARLQLITSQINELYGPMYVITQTSEALFVALRDQAHAHGRAFINEDAPQSEEQRSDWRIWVETVFIPMNDRLAEIIVQKSHLIREAEMPECLRAFVVHQAGYKALARRWELGDFSENRSITEFPRQIASYACKSYQELKQEQLRLIAMNTRSRPGRQAAAVVS